MLASVIYPDQDHLWIKVHEVPKTFKNMRKINYIIRIFKRFGINLHYVETRWRNEDAFGSSIGILYDEWTTFKISSKIITYAKQHNIPYEIITIDKKLNCRNVTVIMPL